MNRLTRNAFVIGILFGFVLAAFASRPVAAADDEQMAAQADHALNEALVQSRQNSGGQAPGRELRMDGRGGEDSDQGGSPSGLKRARQGQRRRHGCEDALLRPTRYLRASPQRTLCAYLGEASRQAGGRLSIWTSRFPSRPRQRPLPPQAAELRETAIILAELCRSSRPQQPTKPAPAEWQKTKVDEWHPDAADWATHVADEFLIINNNSERNKAERVAIAKQQQEAGAGAPGDPIVSMSMSDFGTRW